MVELFVEKGLGMHVQCMLKKNRVYTLAEILSKIFVKKNEGKLRTFFMILFDKLTIWCQLNFIKIYYPITACTTYTFTY